MSRKQKLHLAAAVAAVAVGGFSSFASATDIYVEDWSTHTPSSVNYSTVQFPTTSNPSNASVVSGVLTTSSGTTALGSANIRVFTPTSAAGATASGLTSLYDTGNYNSKLDANGDGNILTWTLNLQESRSNPSGFGLNNSGVAYVLGATSSDFYNAGEGYAVVIGSTVNDPVSLVHYTAGMAAIGTGAKSAPFSVITAPDAQNASTRYQSVKVQYEPGRNLWKMYVRDDGTTAFTSPDPVTGTPIPDDKLVGLNFQVAADQFLDYAGFAQSHTSTNNDSGRFDNIRLTKDAFTAPAQRNLMWDSDFTGSATDGNGTWTTTNTWIDTADNTTHATWDNARFDNAIFGTGSGSGAFTVTLPSNQFVGSVTFAGNSPTYTLSGAGALQLTGNALGQGIVATQSGNISSPVNTFATQTWQINNPGTTLTISGALGGSGHIQKNGTGTVVVTTAATGLGGGIRIATGTMKFNAASGGVAFGTGLMEIDSGATLHLDGTTPMTLTSASGSINMGDGSTLRVTGTVDWEKNFLFMATGTSGSPKNSTWHVDAGGTFIQGRQLKNDSSPAENFHTIHVDGPGTVKLINGGAGGPNSADIFSGSWDLSNGTMILGQNAEITGSGDALLNTGFKGADNTVANTVTIRGTGLLLGTENVGNPGTNPPAYKANIKLQGGTISSGGGVRSAVYVGKDTNWLGNFETVTGTTSTISTYDPLQPATARNLSLVRGNATVDNSQGDTTWNGDLIINPGTSSGGAFIINRNGGNIAVAPGVTFTVNSGAGLTLKNSTDPLSDGTDHVNVVNNSSTPGVLIQDSPKNVGNLDGTGSTQVDSGAPLTANRVRQSALTMNANVTIRQQGGAGGTSNIGTLTRSGTILNLTNNNLVTGNVAGSWNGTAYTGIHNDVASGRTLLGDWSGVGIITSESDAQPGPGKTTLATATGAAVKGLGVGQTAMWAGQTVDDNDTLVMYTWNGDANLSGFVDADDYFQIDSNYNDFANTDKTQNTGLTYNKGDFNYDGIIDGDDFQLIDQGFAASQIGPNFPTAMPAGGVSAVPEPASLALLGFAAAGLLRRRRRMN